MLTIDRWKTKFGGQLNLPSAEFEAVLQSFGLPQMFVDAIVDASVKASKGELNSSSQDLSRRACQEFCVRGI